MTSAELEHERMRLAGFKCKHGIHSETFRNAILKRARVIKSKEKLDNFIDVLGADSPTGRNLAEQVKDIRNQRFNGNQPRAQPMPLPPPAPAYTNQPGKGSMADSFRRIEEKMKQQKPVVATVFNKGRKLALDEDI